MPRVKPLDRKDLAEFEPFFEVIEQTMGFVPNSMLTLGRAPDLLTAFSGLAGTVLMSGKLAPDLKQLVAFVASNAAGCRYCQAHTSHSARRLGVDAAKIDATFEFETSDLFTDAERAALRLARAASVVPNETNDEHFAALRPYFGDEEIVELVAVISLFGWLNRWNDTMATALERGPLAFAASELGDRGWSAGKHDPDPA